MKKYLTPVNEINFIQYATNPLHRLLSKDENIGYNAENLTIVILSCNRVNNTLKLIDSIIKECKNFGGKILIADNGSNKENIDALKEKLSNITIQNKIVEFGENLGVAKGRNYALKHVDTKWVMFLDNDIYFIKNIFPGVQRAIAQMGCKFINIPLINSDKKTLFSYGGHIYLNIINKLIHIGCGSTYKQEDIDEELYAENCLGTFLFGGSSIVEKETFILCGGFDEKMFIGFEDIDFSINIFNRGYKIGCCKEIGLIHNHQKSMKQEDIDYEKKRFSSQKLYESAKYFKEKNGFEVWSESIEEWLKQREKDLGIQVSGNKKVVIKKKKKIALIVDTKNWAYDNIAQNICKYLKDKYDFKVVYMDEIPDNNIVYLFYACLDCDLVHFLWRGILNYINGDFIKYYTSYYGRGFNSFKEEIIDKFCITCSVYDHKYLNRGIQRTVNILESVKAYTVSSRKLFDIYNNLNVKNPNMEITDGVNLKKFYPINKNRFVNIKDRALVIGWVGNSEWNGNSKTDYKGLNTVIKPAINELIEEGYNIKLKFTDKKENFIPHDEMVNFYSKIDLYVCASLNEGTPNPILEAMACGIPVISTDVGIVPEVFGKIQMKYILEERTKDGLKEKIKLFIENLEDVILISDENLCQIQQWSWENKVKDFEKFFDSVIREGKKENEKQ